MTVIRPNSITGVTSITAQGDNISFYSSDGVSISQFNANINATSGVSTVANLNATGVITATSFVGNLTGNSSYASTSGVSTYTSTAGIATYSSTAGIATNLLGGNVGVNTTTTPTNLYVQGNAASNIVSIGNTNATTTLNFTQGNNFSLTLTGNITIANPTGVTTGQSGVILIQENGTGGYTCAWGTSWDFASSTAPTLTTTANALNALPYFARSTTSIVVGSVIAGIGTL